MKKMLYLLLIIPASIATMIFFNLIGCASFKQYSVASEAMFPNLVLGQRVLARGKIFWFSKVAYGDIILFYPQSTGRYWDTVWLKRVVGLPGDRVQMKEGRLFINDKAVTSVTVLENYKASKDRSFPQIEEVLPNGVTYPVLDWGDYSLDNTVVYTVPAKHYFVMGDHRDNSNDSRSNDPVGYVPEDRIISKIIY